MQTLPAAPQGDLPLHFFEKNSRPGTNLSTRNRLSDSILQVIGFAPLFTCLGSGRGDREEETKKTKPAGGLAMGRGMCAAGGLVGAGVSASIGLSVILMQPEKPEFRERETP